MTDVKMTKAISEYYDMIGMVLFSLINLLCTLINAIIIIIISLDIDDSFVRNISIIEISIQFLGAVCVIFTWFYFNTISQKIKVDTADKKNFCPENTKFLSRIKEQDKNISVSFYLRETVCITVMAVGTLSLWFGVGLWIPVNHLSGWNSKYDNLNWAVLYLMIGSRASDTLCLIIGHAWAVVARKCR